MIASLPMYQRPELAAAHARYWSLIRRRLERSGIDAPGELTQDADVFAVWNDPALVLGQTCGMPFRNGLYGQVELIGTPDFGVDGCAPGHYRSAVVVRRADPRTAIEDFAAATLAYNQNHSQSGYAAIYHHAASRGFWFALRVCTGGHLASARAVADGAADIAAIDAVTWRLLDRYEPFAASLRVLDWTEPTPGLPYIAGLGADVMSTSAAVAEAIAVLTAEDREALGLRGLISLPAAAYLAVENPPDEITEAL